MKLFERHGGYWLFWGSAIYLAVGLYCAVYYKDIPTAAIQLPWLFVIAGPLLFPPLGRWLNMSVDWDRKMFNWFKGKNEHSNVVPFPSGTKTEESPPEAPKEKPANTFYRLGLTDNQRVSLQMGYSEITMSRQGVDNFIRQLEVFRDQLPEDTDND